MNCQACGNANPEGVKFCGECGAGAEGRCDLRRLWQREPARREVLPRVRRALSRRAGGDRQHDRRHADARAVAGLPSSFADGRYTVKRFLGEGGRKKRLPRARRQARPRRRRRPDQDRRPRRRRPRRACKREAQAMGRLGDHPHIVTIFDIGDDDGQPYIVSQYMAGGAVDGLLNSAPRPPPADPRGASASPSRSAGRSRTRTAAASSTATSSPATSG